MLGRQGLGSCGSGCAARGGVGLRGEGLPPAGTARPRRNPLACPPPPFHLLRGPANGPAAHASPLTPYAPPPPRCSPLLSHATGHATNSPACPLLYAERPCSKWCPPLPPHPLPLLLTRHRPRHKLVAGQACQRRQGRYPCCGDSLGAWWMMMNSLLRRQWMDRLGRIGPVPQRMAGSCGQLLHSACTMHQCALETADIIQFQNPCSWLAHAMQGLCGQTVRTDNLQKGKGMARSMNHDCKP